MTDSIDVGPVSGPLIGFLLASRWEDLPDDVRHQAKRSILNFLAAAIGGSRDAAVDRAMAVLSRFAGDPVATVVGRPEKLDPLNAAFLNAASGNVFDFDDTHHPTIIHPSAPVAPPLLALAEMRRLPGEAFLHAFVLGVEVACRLGNSVSPGHYNRGWHITSTCGVFGAAAAAGKVLGLDRRGMLAALGNASAQSAGLIETLGTMSKSIGVGNSARGGLFAALLAEAGYSGPAEPIAGPRGFGRVMGDRPDFDAVTRGLGETWELRANTHKPYPCGVVLFPVIDACLELRARPRFSIPEISSITVEGHPLLRARADRPNVSSGREAQVSAQHSVAAVLLHGAAGIRQFADECVASEAVQALRKKIEVREVGGLPVESARVTIRMRSGQVLEATIASGRGTPQRPMSDAEIESKLRELVELACPAIEPQPLIEAVWSLDRSADAALTVALAAPRG
jgi:2-methylcitrate dehydratase PrpD